MGCVHGRHSLALQEVQTEDDAYEPLERRHCTTTAAAAGRPIATSQQLLLNRSQVDPAELAPTDYVIKPTVGGKCGVYKAEHVQRSFLCHKWPSNKAFERNLQKLADSKDSIQADIEKLLRGILSSFPFPANAAMCAQPRSPPVTFVNHRHRRTDTVPKATSSNDQGVTEDRSCPCRSEMSIAAQYPLNYMVVVSTTFVVDRKAVTMAYPLMLRLLSSNVTLSSAQLCFCALFKTDRFLCHLSLLKYLQYEVSDCYMPMTYLQME